MLNNTPNTLIKRTGIPQRLVMGHTASLHYIFKVSVTVRGGGVGMFMRLFDKSYKV